MRVEQAPQAQQQAQMVSQEGAPQMVEQSRGRTPAITAEDSKVKRESRAQKREADKAELKSKRIERKQKSIKNHIEKLQKDNKILQGTATALSVTASIAACIPVPPGVFQIVGGCLGAAAAGVGSAVAANDGKIEQLTAEMKGNDSELADLGAIVGAAGAAVEGGKGIAAAVENYKGEKPKTQKGSNERKNNRQNAAATRNAGRQQGANQRAAQRPQASGSATPKAAPAAAPAA